MRLYFDLVYSKRGIISSAEVNERQTYYSDTENVKKHIRSDLIKSLNLLGKASESYLRVGIEETVYDGVQRFAICQRITDVEDGLYEVTEYISKNECDEKKCNAKEVKEMIIEYFDEFIVGDQENKKEAKENE